MIILSRNVDTLQGQLKAGKDVEGVLSEDAINDLLKRGWAYKASSAPKQENPSGDNEEPGSDLESNQENKETENDPESDQETEGSEILSEDEVEKLEDDEVLAVDRESLTAMKSDELKAIGKEFGVEGYANLKKADLVEAILAVAEKSVTEGGDAE